MKVSQRERTKNLELRTENCFQKKPKSVAEDGRPELAITDHGQLNTSHYSLLFAVNKFTYNRIAPGTPAWATI